MSKESKTESTPDGQNEVGIAQVQNLLQAVQLSLGGAQDKYQVLEAEYKVQQAELSETKAENAKLKKKLQKAVNKLAASEEKKEKGDTKSADAATISSNPRDTSSEIDRIREIYLNPSARLPPKLIRGKTGCSYAFCVLVMNRDSYALGAAVLAHRLKKLNTKADIVCMVTRDVSLGVVEALASEFNAVFQVPYLEYSCKKMTTKKQQKYYGHWIEKSFTKWNALALTVYKKVILLDADILPVSNIDHLFEMSAPAATFSSPWAKTYRKDGFADPYKGLRHGDFVDKSMIRDAIRLCLEYSEKPENKGSYLAIGSIVLLEPNITSYGIFNSFVCSQQPFGIPGCHSGFDEQSIVLFYYLQNHEVGWTHISQEYSALFWHENWIEGCDVKAYHYFNTKPWELSPETYPDLKMWYQAATELVKANSQCAYLTEVCMKDTVFLDIYRTMAAKDSKLDSKKKTADLPPMLVDGASDESQSSSPRPDSKTTKPLKADTKLGRFSSGSSDDHTDPPNKLDALKSQEAMSVYSDGAVSRHSEAVSVRSRESSRSLQRRSNYDDYDRPIIKDASRVRQSESRRGYRSPAVVAVDDFGPIYPKDALGRRPGHHLSSDRFTAEYRRMRKQELMRDRTMPIDFGAGSRSNSERWLARGGLGHGFVESPHDRSSRHLHLSHSPVNPRALGKFDSFGSSSTSSNSHLYASKHDRRRF